MCEWDEGKTLVSMSGAQIADHGLDLVISELVTYRTICRDSQELWRPKTRGTDATSARFTEESNLSSIRLRKVARDPTCQTTVARTIDVDRRRIR